MIIRLSHRSPVPPADPVRGAHSSEATIRRSCTLKTPETPLMVPTRSTLVQGGWYQQTEQPSGLERGGPGGPPISNIMHMCARAYYYILYKSFFYLKNSWTTWTTPKNPNVHAVSLVPPHPDHPGTNSDHQIINGSFWRNHS